LLKLSYHTGSSDLNLPTPNLLPPKLHYYIHHHIIRKMALPALSKKLLMYSTSTFPIPTGAILAWHPHGHYLLSSKLQ